MCNELNGLFNLEMPTTDPLLELNGIENKWLRQAKTLPPNKYQAAESQIHATAKKIRDLFSSMKLSGATPAEIQLKAKEQFFIFNKTCELMMQNQNHFQNSKDTLRNNLSHFDDKLHRPSPNASPLRLDPKNPPSEKMQKDDLWAFCYGDKEQLQTCLADHSLLKLFDNEKERKTIAKLGSEKFAGSEKLGIEVRKGALEIVKDLKGLPEGRCLKLENSKDEKIRERQTVKSIEIALKDCSDVTITDVNKIEPLKTYHYPDKETLKTCLSNHPTLKTQYYEKNGITKTVADLGSKKFASSKKFGLGVQLGAVQIVEDLYHQPAGKCLKSGEISKDSYNSTDVVIATEKALIDCALEETNKDSKDSIGWDVIGENLKDCPY